MIGIIDYGLGNLASIRNMLRRLEIASVISSDAEVLRQTDRLILPGVGAFDQGISNLHSSGLWEPLHDMVQEQKKLLLGICLGVQLLTEGSDEGQLPGLGWIRGRSIAFDRSRLSPTQRIPNMGWRYIDAVRDSPLTVGLPHDARFYFVHSYHLDCADRQDTILTATHGYPFTCSVAKENIFGVQFHPEKSHKFGMALLKNFSQLTV